MSYRKKVQIDQSNKVIGGKQWLYIHSIPDPNVVQTRKAQYKDCQGLSDYCHR